MSKFEGPEDWFEWPPEEKRSNDRYDLGTHDGYGLPEMSLVEVDGGLRLTLSEGRDFVGKTLTPDMVRRVGNWMLAHTEPSERPYETAAVPDPHSSAIKPGEQGDSKNSKRRKTGGVGMSATWEERKAWEAKYQLKEAERKLGEVIALLNRAEDNFACSGDIHAPVDCDKTLKAAQKAVVTMDDFILSLKWAPEDLSWISIKAHQQQLREKGLA